MVNPPNRSQIYIPEADEWKGFPHGQWLLDRPGMFINFEATHEYVESGGAAADLAAFLASNEPFLRFTDPHIGATAWLSRSAAQRITIIACAKSAKVRVRPSLDGKNVELVEAATGLPIGRR